MNSINQISRFVFSIVFCVMMPFTLQASEKILESFNSSNQFYTSVYPSGTLSLSIDASIKVEGKNSVKANYTIPAAGFGEIFRSYGTNTLDLSFQPLGLSFYVKGNTNQQGNLKIMLYEDINMNGSPYDVGDEIWEITIGKVLNNTTWTKQSVLFSDFTKFGGGKSTLDLDRIYAWRIVIENNTSNTINESIWIDDLRQVTSYIPQLSNGSQLNGSFIQLWNTTACQCGQWTQTEWETHMQAMKDACMGKLIVQYSVYNDNAWYSSSTASFVTYKNPTLTRMFAAAQKVGINLYLGLYFDETWNTSDKAQSSTYNTVLTKHKKVIDDIWALHSNESRFKGWYIPQEINDLEWQTNTKRDLLAHWLQSTAAYAKSKDATKQVMIAPYFGPNQPADVMQTWYEQLLNVASNIDIVAPQDGVGTTTKDVDVDIPHYFTAIKKAVEAKGKEFWATTESFQQTNGWPIDANNFAAVPTTMSTLALQLAEAKQIATQLIQFEWGYMQPSLSTASQKLYNDYKVYANCITTSIAVEKAKSISNLFSVINDKQQLKIQALETQHIKCYLLSGEVLIDKELQKDEVIDLPVQNGFILIKSDNGKITETQKLFVP